MLTGWKMAQPPLADGGFHKQWLPEGVREKGKEITHALRQLLRIPSALTRGVAMGHSFEVICTHGESTASAVVDLSGLTDQDCTYDAVLSRFERAFNVLLKAMRRKQIELTLEDCADGPPQLWLSEARHAAKKMAEDDAHSPWFDDDESPALRVKGGEQPLGRSEGLRRGERRRARKRAYGEQPDQDDVCADGSGEDGDGDDDMDVEESHSLLERMERQAKRKQEMKGNEGVLLDAQIDNAHIDNRNVTQEQNDHGHLPDYQRAYLYQCLVNPDFRGLESMASFMPHTSKSNTVVATVGPFADSEGEPFYVSCDVCCRRGFYDLNVLSYWVRQVVHDGPPHHHLSTFTKRRDGSRVLKYLVGPKTAGFSASASPRVASAPPAPSIPPIPHDHHGMPHPPKKLKTKKKKPHVQTRQEQQQQQQHMMAVDRPPTVCSGDANADRHGGNGGGLGVRVPLGQLSVSEVVRVLTHHPSDTLQRLASLIGKEELCGDTLVGLAGCSDDDLRVKLGIAAYGSRYQLLKWITDAITHGVEVPPE
ncbi:unnamed protein product [Vitrella brassicaformis CCMP3155]|uniref:SAM domain-containing protein n=1 Tax=Vitrella brassicaformis (strain CCMP3155) TaxID=1169540 RepID=A0A0G4F0Z8_VITBC|nr:unnamed protein product [Vitrella brassicaformis CCMP3155]|eukprot:CEM05547.1 unnamed protein product [Vitrella brassicaformis CCMP3155]